MSTDLLRRVYLSPIGKTWQPTASEVEARKAKVIPFPDEQAEVHCTAFCFWGALGIPKHLNTFRDRGQALKSDTRKIEVSLALM
jgi:hypothetical protein